VPVPPPVVGVLSLQDASRLKDARANKKKERILFIYPPHVNVDMVTGFSTGARVDPMRMAIRISGQ
jgi:hypothetical protein